MTDDNLKEFEEMFDLVPSKDEDEGQAEEYGNSKDSTEPFSELVEEVSSEIKETTDTGTALENPHDVVKEIMAKSEKHTEILPEIIKPEPEPTPEPEINTEIACDDFDTLPEMDIIEKPKEEPPEEPKEEVKEVVADMSEFHSDIKEKEIKTISAAPSPAIDHVGTEDYSMMDGDKVNWSMKSPSEMYDNFYRKKKVVLDSCIFGGQIEFSLWARELEDAQVDVVTEVFDQKIIIKQMEDVQQFRNRVKYIGVRVNNQYFLFDRFAPLLRGYLARVQYIKPALKQDGLVLEHMGDIEFYFERLRSLHKSVADAEKNLAAAYEMLSRKVTICMELPPVERYTRPDRQDKVAKFQYEEKPVAQAPSGELSDFDDLPMGAEAGPEEKKSGPTGWDSL
jgi:hypothetical protein